MTYAEFLAMIEAAMREMVEDAWILSHANLIAAGIDPDDCAEKLALLEDMRRANERHAKAMLARAPALWSEMQEAARRAE